MWDEGLVRSIDAAIGHAFRDGKEGRDNFCYLSARIAANYAFQLRPDLREPTTWKQPDAMQFRGRIGEQWRPGRLYEG